MTSVDAGRPFLVRGELRAAPPVSSAAWCGTLRGVRASGLAPRVRRTIADHYARAGLLEHASVAAFARFVLQLTAVGAPPAMVLDAQAAMADEVRHAQTCLSIARTYGGSALSPGPLCIDGALSGRHDLATVTRATIREGCVGETLAALEVEEAATWARDAALASALARIAEDEIGHARLAWRFVAWAVAQADGLLRGHIERWLWEAVEAARHAVPAGGRRHALDTQLRAHGVLSRRDRRAVHRRALDTIVEPAAATLLAHGHGSGASSVSRLA